MLAFRVTLGRAVAWPVTVRYATADGTATAGADYEAASGTLTFAAGETEKTVSVAALADGTAESAETLTLTLTDPSGATLARATATGPSRTRRPGPRPRSPRSSSACRRSMTARACSRSSSRFSEEPPELSFATVRDRLLAVTGGKIKRAKRIARGSNRAFRIHVEPAGPGRRDGGVSPGAGVRRAGGGVHGRRAGARRDSHGDHPRPGLALGGGRRGAGRRGRDPDFTVRLSRARHEATTVDYATSDGTAVAGEDYTAASGTLTFAAGETGKTVSVPILDDAHDDDGETLTLTLSNPRPAETVRLGDATATGTIRNSDAAQRAWLARFGRTVADQVVDAVQARIEAGADAPAHLTPRGRACRARRGREPHDARRLGGEGPVSRQCPTGSAAMAGRTAAGTATTRSETARSPGASYSPGARSSCGSTRRTTPAPKLGQAGPAPTRPPGRCGAAARSPASRAARAT